MTQILLLPHLGLGDQLIMNGLVHYLREESNATSIVICVKDIQLATLKELYEDYSNISFFPVQGDEEVFGSGRNLFQQKVQSYMQKGYSILPFGVFTGSDEYLKLDPCWANCFYAQYGIPSSIRFQKFQLPRNMEKSQLRWRQLVERVGPNYVVLHDDPSRNLGLPYSRVLEWMTSKKIEEYPVVYLGDKRYNEPLCPHTRNPRCADIVAVDSILDYVDILRNARGAIMMDSCLALLLDLVNQSAAACAPSQNRVSFIRHTTFPTKGLYQCDWDFVEV